MIFGQPFAALNNTHYDFGFDCYIALDFKCTPTLIIGHIVIVYLNTVVCLLWSAKLFKEYWDIVFAKYGDKVRWGGDFDLNRKIDKKIDLPHLEVGV